MFLKRKQRVKLKAKGCVKGSYHYIFNHKMESSSDLVQSNTYECCSMMNTTDYNYKLSSVIGRENDSTPNKRTWFDKQVQATLLWSWMILQAFG